MKRKIDSKSVFGFEYFKRFRILENEIQLNGDKSDINQLGFYPFKENNKFLLNSINRKEWISITEEILVMAFYNLIINSHIKLVYIEEKNEVLLSSLGYETKSYEFKFLESNLCEDIFSKVLLKAIKDCNETKNNDITHVLHNLTNQFLNKNKNYNSPFKSFITKLINGYITQFENIEYQTETMSHLLIFNEKSFVIKDANLTKRQQNFEFIRNKIKDEEKKSLEYSKFNNELKKKITSIIFSRRDT